MIRWTTEFSVDVPELDKEHQFLFTALNDFYEGLRLGAPKENLSKLIDNLISYTQMHFAHEERILLLAGYSGLTNHKKEHQEFIERAIEFQKKFNDGKLLVSLEVTGFIKDWILNHILNEDTKYTPFVKRFHHRSPK